MKVAVWIEDNDPECQNWFEQGKNTTAPTFDVTVSLVGIVTDGK